MKQISVPSRKRLVILSHVLSQLKEKKVTSAELSAITGWGDATIRRDISLLELHNGERNGYDAQILRRAIRTALNIGEERTEKRRCCIVGLGKLGEALLDASALEGSPFEIVAGFDTSMNKIEIMKSTVPLFPTLDLEQKIRSLKIEFVALAVPDEKAQFMAERLAAYGIRGILNYTNALLSVPSDVRVENVGMVQILMGMAAG